MDGLLKAQGFLMSISMIIDKYQNHTTIGIYIGNCINVNFSDNKFHNIDRPVVTKGVKNLQATGNIVTYGTQEFRVLGFGGYALHPLTVAIWKIHHERK